jgi:hypothetical protein
MSCEEGKASRRVVARSGNGDARSATCGGAIGGCSGQGAGGAHSGASGGVSGYDRTHDALTRGGGGVLKDGDGRSQGGQSDAGGG